MGIETVIIAGAVLGAAGSIMGGNAKKQAAEDTATYQVDEAKAQAKKIRDLARQQRGEATASYAASGVDVGEGTPLLTDAEITRRSEEDALMTILGAKRQAGIIKREGKAQQTAGYYQAAGSVLGAAGGIGGGGWQRAAGAGGGLSSSATMGTQMTDLGASGVYA
jgi:hypothetical protein